MSYTKNIKVYRVIQSINIPLAEAPQRLCAELDEGDLIVTVDTNVWVDFEHPDENREDRSLAIIGTDFIEINDKFFQPL